MEAVLNEDRQEGSKTVHDRYTSNLDEAMEPALHILSSGLDVAFRVVASPARVRFHDHGTLPHDHLVLIVEEIRRLEVLGRQKDAHRRPNHGS